MALTLRRVVVLAVQYAIAIAALAWVLTQVEVGTIVDRLSTLDVATLVALAAVSLVGVVARFYTWQAVMGAVQPTGLRAAANTDLVVNFINQLLPSRLSGRAAAPFVVRSQTGMDYADATAVSGVHTGIFAVLYGVTASAGLLAAIGRLPVGLLLLLVLSTGLYLLAGTVVLLAGSNLQVLDPVVAWLAGVAGRVPRVGETLATRIRGTLEFTAASTTAFRDIAGDPGVWARYALGWVGTLVLAPGVRVWLLFASFGVEFTPLALLPLYLVAAYSVTLLPLTPGGIGVTEATATAVFVALGVPGEVVVPVIFIDRSLGVYLPALAGWYPSVQLDLSALSTE